MALTELCRHDGARLRAERREKFLAMGSKGLNSAPLNLRLVRRQRPYHSLSGWAREGGISRHSGIACFDTPSP